jgi:DHA1 family bicyclomycin/chloramphenicol resistance-like MFS transporter
MIAIGPLTVDMYLPALPSLAVDLRADTATAQVTITGMLAGMGLGQLVAGPVSDAVGRRLPLLVGLGAFVLASLACAVAPTMGLLIAARVGQGLAAAGVSVSTMALVRDLFSGLAAARLLSRLMLVMGVAPVLAPSLGGQVLRATSWRGVFVVLAVAGAVLAAIASIGLPETLPVARRRSARPVATLWTYRDLLADRVFVGLVLVGGLMFAAMFAYVSGSPFVLPGRYGLSSQHYAMVFGINAFGIVVCTQLNPVLLRRWSSLQILSAAVAIAFAAAATLVLTTATGLGGLPGVLVPMGVVVGVCGLAFPNTPALALSRHGEAAGSAAALLGSAQFAVGGAAAPLVGLLGTDTGVPMGVVMATVTGWAGALLIGVVWHRQPTVPATRAVSRPRPAPRVAPVKRRRA